MYLQSLLLLPCKAVFPISLGEEALIWPVPSVVGMGVYGGSHPFLPSINGCWWWSSFTVWINSSFPRRGNRHWSPNKLPWCTIKSYHEPLCRGIDRSNLCTRFESALFSFSMFMLLCLGQILNKAFLFCFVLFSWRSIFPVLPFQELIVEEDY